MIEIAKHLSASLIENFSISLRKFFKLVDYSRFSVAFSCGFRLGPDLSLSRLSKSLVVCSHRLASMPMLLFYRYQSSFQVHQL